MSEPIPEAIPTSADPRSRRPTKKRALSPRAGHASQVHALFAKPSREMHIPSTTPCTAVSAPPEMVANVQGSSAGAGSGEFHVYKASRRREYERLRAMDEEVEKEQDEKEFLARKAEQERRDRDKTERNRAKRAKAAARKQKGRLGRGDTAAGHDAVAKRKFVSRPNEAKPHGDEEVDVDGGEVKNAEEIGLVIEDDD
ncbi:hypothetical protein EJ07DRAFT_124105 [Lizonia empirigonia]|nr:hypothetical protein EJ07DRAFT_124105 [Lizonia empirigonia]